ncbi:MAG TPA: hypothetical protein VGE57_09915 [Solimonas sp.]
MKALQIFNVVVLLLCATFFVTLGVVTLMYGYHLDAAPRMRAEWPKVSGTTAVFAVLTLIAYLTFWSQRRRFAWRWPAQVGLLVALTVGAQLLLKILS